MFRCFEICTSLLQTSEINGSAVEFMCVCFKFNMTLTNVLPFHVLKIKYIFL